MGLLPVLAVAFALAIDAFAVAVAVGVSLPRVTFRHRFRLAWHFGLFQTVMTLIGFYAGVSIRNLIERFDHWVAFGLLLAVGANMLRDAWSGPGDRRLRGDPTRGASLLLLSVATSIDALAVGLGLSVIDRFSIVLPALLIGVVASAMTVAGLYLGAAAARLSVVSRWAQAAGALVLWSIGVRILYSHMA